MDTLPRTRIRRDNLRIDKAAIRTEDGTVYSLPRPNRHHNVIAHMAAAGLGAETVARSEQGFVTECGRWVCRSEALQIALAAGQLPKISIHPRQLFSEDVW